MTGSLVVDIYSLKSLAYQNWKENFKAARPQDIKMDWTNLPGDLTQRKTLLNSIP